jgi:hypothetical protein
MKHKQAPSSGRINSVGIEWISEATVCLLITGLIMIGETGLMIGYQIFVRSILDQNLNVARSIIFQMIVFIILAGDKN